MARLETRIITASKLLQAKVGVGTIAPERIAACQELIDKADIDFPPMARDLLQDLRIAMNNAVSTDAGENDKKHIDNMARVVMQIKGQAGMFGYELVGDLADITLHFLEALDTLDQHVMEIMEAHYKTLTLIIKNDMKGSGGKYGAQLRTELRNACKRYFAKIASGHESRKNASAKDDSEIFYVG